MNRFQGLILVLLLSLHFALGASAHVFPNETLHYKVNYKWGLIHKQAGSATLTLKNSGPNYVVQLTASSQPWADKFYQVRDTLNGLIAREPFLPLFYEKIAHEGSDDKHDTVKFSYGSNGAVTGECTRHSVKKGREPINQQLTLQAQGTTVDMLSSFYFMRSLPFEDWETGRTLDVTIFSGKRKELLSITYHGISPVKADDKTYNCYHITFKFTSDGRKKSSDDMDAWISTSPGRIPIRLEGKLPVGKVHCLYTGGGEI